MANTTFIDKVTHVISSWLNPVNKAVYEAIGDGTNAPTQPAEVRVNLGLASTTAPSGASRIGNSTAGGSLGVSVQAALDLKAPLDNPFFTTAVHVTGPQTNTGQLLIQDGKLLALGTPATIITAPTGFEAKTAFFTRYASNGSGVVAALCVETQVPAGHTAFEWNQLNVLYNAANAGQNVAFYSQAHKQAAGATWAGVFEARDETHTTPSAALYGLEVDIAANGTDVSGLGFQQRFGLQMVGYRDWGPVSVMSASISGTVLTVSSVQRGRVEVGSTVGGTGVTAGTVIASLGTGTGGVGTYNVNNSQTIASADLTFSVPVVTASIAGATMTVTAVLNGVITVGQRVVGVEVVDNTTITALGTGTGGTGTYTVSNAQTVASRTLILGGGEVNIIGNGLVIQNADSDPGGTKFTNSINLASNGDIGLAIPGHHTVAVFHSGHSTYGMKWHGTYATAVCEVITASDVPLLALDSATGLSYFMVIGSANNFLSAAALGAYAGKVKIKVDGNDRWIPFYS